MNYEGFELCLGHRSSALGFGVRNPSLCVHEIDCSGFVSATMSGL